MVATSMLGMPPASRVPIRCPTRVSRCAAGFVAALLASGLEPVRQHARRHWGRGDGLGVAGDGDLFQGASQRVVDQRAARSGARAGRLRPASQHSTGIRALCGRRSTPRRTRCRPSPERPSTVRSAAMQRSRQDGRHQKASQRCARINRSKRKALWMDEKRGGVMSTADALASTTYSAGDQRQLGRIHDALAADEALDPLPRYYLVGSKTSEPIELPEEIYQVLRQAVDAMQKGLSVTISPTSQTLTTQQAADLLGISRPTLIKTLDSGKLPLHPLGHAPASGAHRRPRLSREAPPGAVRHHRGALGRGRRIDRHRQDARRSQVSTEGRIHQAPCPMSTQT